MDIIWSKDAGDELSEIISFIKYNSGKINAKNVYEKINKEILKVSKNAAGRRIAPLLLKFGIKYIHQFNISSWSVFYKVENNRMEIVSIIDQRRNLEEILYEKIINGKIV
jgi:toxin ParE1/3/4